MKKTIFLAVVCFLAMRLDSTNATLVINEFMVSNVLAYKNADGDYEDWIEIYNSGNAAVNLAGYYLTDDIQAKNYWKIPTGSASKTMVPAKGFLVLYADGNPNKGANHLGFKLNDKGEQIALIAQDGKTVLDDITYADQFMDISYGRYPDGGSLWNYFTQFTPGASNKQGFVDFVYAPWIEQTAGFYNGSVTVSVLASNIGDAVRYTLDGSDPTATSTLYSAPVLIDRTSIFKARAFKNGALPSLIATKTFLIDADHSLPVLALITDPDNLYDPDTGIYMHDNDGRPWERPAVLEFFPKKALGFHAPAGIRIQGNTGPTTFNKKSFRAYFRKGYGDGKLEYPLYPRDSVTSFSAIVLRAGYDDSMDPQNPLGTLLRDPVATELWRRTGSLVSQSRFSVMYMNNNFQGIYDVKESIDEDFVKDHLGYEDLDLMRTRWDSTELVYGSRDEWRSLVQFFESNTFTSDTKLAEAERLMDLENFTTLQAMAHAVAYKSWAYGTFMYREKVEGARWGWTIWDSDRSFTEMDFNVLTSTYNVTMVFLNNTITKKLLQNPTYRNRYINRTADLLNTSFSPETVKSIIDSLAYNIEADIPDEVSKWNNTVAKWEQNVALLKDFTDSRPGVVRRQLQDYFQLRDTAELHLELERGSGKIKVNTVTVGSFPWSGKYFQNVPVMLTALPDPGYRFQGWSDPSLPSDPVVTLNLSGDKTVKAIFTPVGDINAELIAPSRIRSGQRFPVVVRIRDGNWNINPLERSPIQVTYGGAHADTTFKIRRGAGTGVVQVQSSSDFTLSVGNTAVPETQKTVTVPESYPSVNYSGTLPSGDVVWDSSADRIITGNLTVPSGCRLTIKAGVWVLLKKYVNFDVRGRIQVEGTEKEPVVFAPETWSDPWGGLEFQGTTASFRYCFFVNGGGDMSKGMPQTTPSDTYWHTGHQHILFAKGNSEMTLDQCFFLNSIGKALGAHYSKVTVTNSVSSFVWHGGEFHWSRLFYQNSHLMNLPNDDHIYAEDIDTDGFHIDYVDPNHPEYSVIDRCWFVTGKDDAVDHHWSRLKISNCWFEDFVHEGLAASGGWTEGGVTRGPIVLVDHCVAVGNRIAGLRIGDDYARGAFDYRCFLKATNTVVFDNKDNIMNFISSTASPLPDALEISYSMTNDSDYNNSPRCITGTPQFDPYYYLLPGSPGAGAGTCGTNMGRADSAAIETGSVVINEIMYNAPAEANSGDWIELYNPQSVSQDISRWILEDEDDTHQFSIPQGTVVQPLGYWVLCADENAFNAVYPNVENVTGGIPFGFGKNDQVRLFARTGQPVDSVAYDNNDPWPGEADGKGYSLELISPASDNSLPSSWAKSIPIGGSPGRANRRTDVESKSDNAPPWQFALEQNYPNPFNPRTRINYALPRPGKVRLEMFDLRGRKVLDLVEGQRLSAGLYEAELDAKNLSTGIYFYRIEIAYDNGARDVQTKKMVLIK
jgi:hypothetical protein